MCYKLIQRFRVTGLFTGQYNTEGYGTIIGTLFPFGQYCSLSEKIECSKGWHHGRLLFGDFLGLNLGSWFLLT